MCAIAGVGALLVYTMNKSPGYYAGGSVCSARAASTAVPGATSARAAESEQPADTVPTTTSSIPKGGRVQQAIHEPNASGSLGMCVPRIGQSIECSKPPVNPDSGVWMFNTPSHFPETQ